MRRFSFDRVERPVSIPEGMDRAEAERVLAAARTAATVANTHQRTPDNLDDADHAVALEREQIVEWLKPMTLDHRIAIQGIDIEAVAVIYEGSPQEFVDALLNGDHWRQR